MGGGGGREKEGGKEGMLRRGTTQQRNKASSSHSNGCSGFPVLRWGGGESGERDSQRAICNLTSKASAS